jgi:hypothetical protein
MKKILFAILAIATLSIVFPSCGKYEEGPKISLASKKSRLQGDWKIKKYMINDVDQTAGYLLIVGNSSVIGIEKDGKYSWTFTGGTAAGTWALGEDKDDVTFTPTSGSTTTNTYRILRLKSKELWWKQTQSNGDVWEYQFEPAD